MTGNPSRFHYALYYLALASGFSAAVFIANNFLIHLLGWQGAFVTLSGLGLLSGDETDNVTFTGLLQTAAFIVALAFPVYMTRKVRGDAFLNALSYHENRFHNYAAYVVLSLIHI